MTCEWVERIFIVDSAGLTYERLVIGNRVFIVGGELHGPLVDNSVPQRGESLLLQELRRSGYFACRP